MTIDELFAMPICEMYDWMQQNYHDPVIIRNAYLRDV